MVIGMQDYKEMLESPKNAAVAVEELRLLLQETFGVVSEDLEQDCNDFCDYLDSYLDAYYTTLIDLINEEDIE